MDIQAIVKELKRERDRVNKAIVALEETESFPAPRKASLVANVSAPSRKRRSRLTPEGRKRLSDAMKKRWADKRKPTSRGGK